MQAFKNAVGVSFSAFKTHLKLFRGDPGSRHICLMFAVASGDRSWWPAATRDVKQQLLWGSQDGSKQRSFQDEV